MPTAFIPVLLLATPALPPAVCGGDHAALHPAEADLYYACPDLPALVAAYDGAALVRILRDPELVAAVAALSEGAVQLADFDAASVWEKLLAEVPPEVVALGVPDALKDLAAVSWSLHVPPDLAARMEALAPLIEGELALRAVVEQVEQQQFWTDALPADLGFLESTDDPWGRPWTYELDGAGGFVVRSLGADGEPGGEGAAADLTSGGGRLEPALSGVVREFRMQLVLEFRSPASAELLAGLALGAFGEGAEPPPGLTAELASRELAGTRLDTLDATFERDGIVLDGWLAAHGARLALGLGGDSRGFAARLEPGAAAGLAARPEYVATGAQLQPGAGPVAVESWKRLSWMGLQATLQRSLLALDEDLQHLPAPVLDGLEVLLGNFSLAQPPSRARTTLEGQRFVTSRFRSAPPAGAPAPWCGTQPIAREPFADLPADAAVAWSGAVDTSRLLEGALGVAAASLDTDPAKLRADCESALGLSLETDLLDLVQPQVVLSSEAVRGIAAPGVRAVARVSDPARFEASLTAVLGHLAARFPGQLETSARPYRGSPYWTVDFRDEVLGFVQPSFGLVGDRLFVGLKGTHVKRELKRFAAGETESHALQSPDLPWGDAVMGVWYVDWGALFDGLYGTVKTFGGLAASMGDQEMPIDFASLPDAEIVTRHLRPTLAITRRVEGGTLTRCESSFGPEIPVALVLAGASAALLGTTSVEPVEPVVWEGPVEFEEEGPAGGEIPPPVPDDADARALTRDALIRVRTGLQVFHYDQGGRYPDALERLLEPSADFPEGFLGGGALPADGWGRALRYRPAADGSAYELWSTGANGVDEEGAGDDVRL